jgi:hypothetical protein
MLLAMARLHIEQISDKFRFDFSTTGSHGDVLLQRLQIGV